jgi:hypothetical protein
MGSSPIIAFPRSDGLVDGAEVGASALTEIDVAIALVASHTTRRVRLTALPFVEAVAATGLAHARAARMAFALERGEGLGVATVTIGPLD